MAALATVNGLVVAEGLVSIPRIGCWHADLSVDSTQAVTGAATLSLGSQKLTGAFARAGFDLRGRLQVRVIGGAGGLGTTLAPKSYGSIPLKVVLQDALRDAGETLSPMADASLLSTQLTAWSRMSAPASSVVKSLMQVVPGAVWRVLIDGTVWVGFEGWPASSLPDTAPIHSEPEKGRITIASDAPAVFPGTTFQFTLPGQGPQAVRVGGVRHIIRANGVRTII